MYLFGNYIFLLDKWQNNCYVWSCSYFANLTDECGKTSMLSHNQRQWPKKIPSRSFPRGAAGWLCTFMYRWCKDTYKASLLHLTRCCCVQIIYTIAIGRSHTLLPLVNVKLPGEGGGGGGFSHKLWLYAGISGSCYDRAVVFVCCSRSSVVSMGEKHRNSPLTWIMIVF